MTYIGSMRLLPVLLLLAAATLHGQSWNANWITHPQVAGSEHAVVYFRTAFELSTLPDSFPIAISADNHYRLYVNGRWVRWGPQLGEVQHWKYDPVDLRPFLRTGRNVLAVQVTNWGHHRFFGQQSVHTGLLIQGSGPAAGLTTRGYNGNYRCYSTRSIRPHVVQWRVADPDIIGGLYANNPTDSLYADRHPWDWELPEFDDTHWIAAQFLEAGHRVDRGSGFLWLLEERRTPPQQRQPQPFARVRESSTALPDDWITGRVPVQLAPGQTHRLLLDMNEVTLGFATLRWSGGKGSTLRYTWAENVFNPDKTKSHRDSVRQKLVKGYFDTVLPDGGRHAYTPTWYRAFRYLEITVQTGDQPLQLYVPSFVRVTSAVPILAEWESDDPLLDEAVAIGRRTVEICTQDYFLSDAYYETMQYVGDTKVHALVWQALTGDFRHTRNALRDFHHGRNADGVLKSCYPLRYNFYHSSYSLIWIDMLLDYLERQPQDAAFVRDMVPGVAQTLAYFDRHYNPTSGFVEDVPYKAFIDWYVNGKGGIAPGNTDDTSVPVTLHYAHALRSAAALYDRLAAPEQCSVDYSARADRVIEGIRRCCYDPERGLLAERPSRDFFDQHSQILGALLGLFSESRIDEVLDRTVRDTSLVQATYYYRFYLLEALRQHERADLFREAVSPWYALVDAGATTMVERFYSKSKPTRSEAHPWGASPTLYVYSLLAGIDFRNDGGPIRMTPRFGHLKTMRGYCPVFGPDEGVRFQLSLDEQGHLRGWVSAQDRPVVFAWQGRTRRIAPNERLDVSTR